VIPIILVDTTYLVDLIRKRVDQESLDNLYDEILFISEISVFELYFGIYANKILAKDMKNLKNRIDTLEKILSRFQRLPFGKNEAIESAKILGQLKLNGKNMEFRDGMIASTGLANGINQILTRNQSHFDRIPGISVISYRIHD